MHDRNLDDRGSNGQDKIQPVLSTRKEPAIIRKISKDANDDLDVEGDGEAQFALVEDFRVSSRYVDVACCLQNKRGQGQGDEAPSYALVDFLESVVLQHPSAVNY